ncbi:MAG: iron-containing alcohol dehydrogenase [Ferrimicrobium sp.]
MPEIIFGIGSLAEVGNALRRTGATRPLLVTDPGICAAGWVDRALMHIGEYGFEVTVWDGVSSNPKDTEISRGLERFREAACDSLVAIGGGSSIDAAKAIAVLSTNVGSILDYEGVDRIKSPIPPMVMLPTTGGTGADVSQFCVITDTTRRLKITIGGRALVPDISITDPYLLTTMPWDISAYTAIDTLAHAIEAYVSKGADFLSDAHAISAIRSISKHLLVSLENPNDLTAREGIARASLQAGLAFSNALLGATHAISHQIGGFLDLHHGMLNAILLPHVIRFNGATHPYRYLDVAEAMGMVADPSSPLCTVELLANRIQLIATEVGVPSGLGSIGVRKEHIPRFAENALHDTYITTNPRPLTAEDVCEICVAAF